MWDRRQWRDLECLGAGGIEEVRSADLPVKMLMKYETLVKSGRAGCIGYGYKKILNDIDRLVAFYERQGFTVDDTVEDQDAHVLSMSRPLFKIRQSLVDRYALCPRLHIDILPLSFDKADVWVMPHIDLHDPSERPRLHKLDRASRFYVRPSPPVKALLKLVLAGKEAKNVVSPLFTVCVQPLGLSI